MADLEDRGLRPSTNLNLEWRRLCADAEANAAAAAWRLADHEGRGLGSLAEVLGACGDDRSVPEALADGVLAAVISWAVRADRLAARVVLQRVVPPLMRRASVRAKATGKAVGELFNDLVAAAWVVICEYPLERRPRKIAVNVIRDAEKAVFGYRASRPFRHEVPAAPELLAVGAARSDGRGIDYQTPADLIVESVLACATRGGVSEPAIELLLEIHLQGRQRWHVARDRGVSTRTISNWRRAAERQLVRALARSDEDFDG